MNLIKDKDNVDYGEMNKIIDKLKPYDEYFNQNLMNKEDNIQNQEEFDFYYHYFQFKLLLNYVCIDNYKKS